MIRRLLAIASLIALGGCAQNGASSPSYLGLSDLASEAEAASSKPVLDTPPKALRDVSSNKVLSAMAFQRVTGRSVDPESLSSADTPLLTAIQ
jgi:hypothetical protein